MKEAAQKQRKKENHESDKRRTTKVNSVRRAIPSTPEPREERKYPHRISPSMLTHQRPKLDHNMSRSALPIPGTTIFYPTVVGDSQRANQHYCAEQSNLLFSGFVPPPATVHSIPMYPFCASFPSYPGQCPFIRREGIGSCPPLVWPFPEQQPRGDAPHPPLRKNQRNLRNSKNSNIVPSHSHEENKGSNLNDDSEGESLSNISDSSICKNLIPGQAYKARNIYKSLVRNMFAYSRKERDNLVGKLRTAGYTMRQIEHAFFKLNEYNDALKEKGKCQSKVIVGKMIKKKTIFTYIFRDTLNYLMSHWESGFFGKISEKNGETYKDICTIFRDAANKLIVRTSISAIS